MAGIEQNMDLNPMLQGLTAKIEQQLQSAAQGAHDIDLNATLHVKTIDMQGLPAAAPVPGYHDPAGQTPGQADAMAKRFMFADTSPVAGAYPSPMGIPLDGLSKRANDLWGGIQGQGAIHSMRELQSGTFEPWAPHLSGPAREQASELARGAGRKDGFLITESAEGMDGAGKKIFTLMQQIEAAGHGTPAAAKAAEQVSKLVGYIDRLGESAGAAADRIGGEAGKAAKEELVRIGSQAKGGIAGGGANVGDQKPGGGNWSAGEIHQLTSDPMGFAMGQAQMGVFSRVAAASTVSLGTEGSMAAVGGAAGVAAIVAASVAALVGGFMLPKLWAGMMSDGADKDSLARIQDYRLSNMVGGKGGDIRGALYDENRMHFSKQAGDDGINFDNVRHAISALGVSFEGSASIKDQYGLYRDIDKRLARRNADAGLADGSLEGFIGQEIRSGGLDRDDFRNGVDRLVGYLAEANKLGISSNEKLGTLAAVNQMAVGKMGFLAADTEKYLRGFQSFLESTGVKGLREQQGAKLMGQAAEGMSQEGQAGLYSDLMNMSKDDFEAFGISAAGSKKDWDSASKGAHGDRSVLSYALMQDPKARLAYMQRMLNGPMKGMDPVVASRLFNIPLTLQGLEFGGALPGATPGAIDYIETANAHRDAPLQFQTGGVRSAEMQGVTTAQTKKAAEANSAQDFSAMMNAAAKETASNTRTTNQLLGDIKLLLQQTGLHVDTKAAAARGAEAAGGIFVGGPASGGILDAGSVTSMR